MNEKPNTTATGDVARPAGTTGDSLLQEAKQTVGHMAEGAKEQVVTRVESGKENVAEKIGNVAGALRAAGEPLADIGPLPDLAGAAADKIESIAEYVQSRTIGDLIQEATVFARREPAIFLGSAFGLGLLAGRFLKSSPRREIHPEIQDDMFEEDVSFTGGVGRFESQQRGYGASVQGPSYGNSTYKASSTQGTPTYNASSTTAPGIGAKTGVTSSVTSTTAPTGNPGVDRTQSSGFGGYGGSFATGSSTPYDTTGSSISAKPSTDVTRPTTGVATPATKPSDVGTWGRTEGQTTKPMGTIGESSATTAAPSSVRSANGTSGNGGAPRSTGRP